MAVKKRTVKAAKKKQAVSAGESAEIPLHDEEVKRIALAFRMLETGRWMWGNLKYRHPSRSLKRRILLTIDDVLEATPLTKESVLQHLGLSPERYAEWESELPKVEKSLHKEDTVRQRWLRALNSSGFWLGASASAVLLSVLSYFTADRQIALFADSVTDTSFVEFFKVYTFAGESFFYLIFTGAGFLFARHANYSAALKSLYVFLSVVISGAAVNILKPLLGRSRPELFLSEDRFGFHLLALDIFEKTSYTMQSFPSGHAATGMAVGVSLSLLFPGFRILWLAFGVSIVMSRLIVNAHFLSDVIIGSLIGIAGAAAAYRIVFRSERDESLYQ